MNSEIDWFIEKIDEFGQSLYLLVYTLVANNVSIVLSNAYPNRFGSDNRYRITIVTDLSKIKVNYILQWNTVYPRFWGIERAKRFCLQNRDSLKPGYT